jgi:hypothetical protein
MDGNYAHLSNHDKAGREHAILVQHIEAYNVTNIGWGIRYSF